jgi:putative peptidoglycan lipid II flippase
VRDEAVSAEEAEPRIMRSSAVVAVGTGLSRVTGMARVIALAVVLGSDVFSDSYFLANTTPNIVYELLIGGVLSATLVPLFVEADQHDDRDGPSALFSVGLTAVLAVTVLAVLGSPLIGRIYATGGPVERRRQLDLVVPMLQLLLPQIFFYGITTLTTGALNARRRFVAAAYTPVLNNLIVIAVAVVLHIGWGGSGGGVISAIGRDRTAQIILGVGTTAGIAAMAGPLVWSVRLADIRLRWNFDWRHPIIRRVVRLSGWTVGYVAANQIALLVVLRLARSSVDGTVTAYQNAFIYFQLPHGLVTVTLMTTFLPELSRAATAGRMDQLRARYLQAVRLLLTLIIPAAVGYVILGHDITRVLLSHGRYSAADAKVTGDALIAFAVGLAGYSLYLFTLNAFYSLKDTRTPFLVNVAENVTNILLALLLFGQGAPGLAAAYSAAYLLAAGLAAWALHRRIGGFVGPEATDLGRQVLRILGASAAMAVVVLVVRTLTPAGFGGSLANLFVAAPLGLAAFLVAGHALGIEGVERAVTTVRSRVAAWR